MKQKTIWTALAAFATLTLSAQNNEKPNLVLFMADDCSYYDLACYGSVDSQTPRIDQFAKEGVRFTKAYEAAPMCSPTRHNLILVYGRPKPGLIQITPWRIKEPLASFII